MNKEPKCLEFKEPVKPAIPENCTGWFDGCNYCHVSGGEIGACTKKFCSIYKEPRCLEEKDTEENTKPPKDTRHHWATRPPTDYLNQFEGQETKFENDIPENCSTWFDGCNNCKVLENNELICSRKFCSAAEK